MPAGEFRLVEPSSAPWRVVEPAQPDDQPAQPGGRDRPWAAIGALLIAVLIAAATVLLAGRSDVAVEVDGDAPFGGSAPSDAGGSLVAAASGTVVVEVGGAVLRPGVYTLQAGARVADAIAAAGGFGPRLDAALADRQLNLAAPVKDGTEVHVPVRGEGAPASAAGGGPATASGPIDLNHATAEALDTLPGVGPATAAKIIAARDERPFASVDELTTRKVVGKATLEKLRALVTVGP